MRAIRGNAIITAEMLDINVQVKCLVHQSCSHYGGILSAINHAQTLIRVQMPERMKRELSIFIAGIERTVTVENQMLGLKFSEFKKSISLEAYKLLAKTLEKRRIFLNIYS